MTTQKDLQDEKEFHAFVVIEGTIKVKAPTKEEAWIKAKKFLNHASSYDIVMELDTLEADVNEVEEW